MATIPPDVLRERRLSLQDWLDSFDDGKLDSEDRRKRNQAAKMLVEHPVAADVLSYLEASCLHKMIKATATMDDEAAMREKLMIIAIDLFRQRLKAMAADASVAEHENSN
jgi:hypothetical protein